MIGKGKGKRCGGLNTLPVRIENNIRLIEKPMAKLYNKTAYY